MGAWSWRDVGSRPLVFPALGLGLGAGVGASTGPWAGAFLLSGCVFAGLALWAAPRAGAHLLLLLGLALSGAGLAGLEAGARLPPTLPRRAVLLEGELTAVGAPEDGQRRVELLVARAEGRPARFGARLALRGAGPALHPGQRVLLRADVRAVEPPGNPGEPDLAGAWARRGLVAVGGGAASGVVVLSAPAPWRGWVDRERAALGATVRRVAPSPAAAALFLTLAAGERAALDAELEEAFRRAGLAHVLSVSGLHVAALALWALAALRFLAVRGAAGRRHLEARRLAAPLALPLVWGYVLYTGWQPPAVRSAVMATVALLGLAAWRRADALNALAAAALALVAWQPSAVADLSLQLSFLAVLSLVLLSPALRALLPPPSPRPEGRLARALHAGREAVVQTVCASVAVTAASAPLVSRAFGEASLAGVLANVACLPLSGALTGFAATSAALHLVHPALALPVAWGGTWVAALFVALTRAFAALPFATLPLPGFGALAAAGWAAALLAFALGARRAAAAGLALTALLAWGVPRLWPRPGLTVTFLSVGHGDAVVVSSGGAHLLVDGGGVPRGADTGRRHVLPFLRERGIRALELAVLSHPHPDHALGLASALAQVPTRRLWLPAEAGDGPLTRAVRAAARGALVEEVEAGRPALTLGEARVEVLGPPRDRALLEGVNDRSVVLRVTHGRVVVLLTGDVEADGEEALLPELGEVTVLKAPHHGSRTSSTPAFVARVRPRHVVFCVGRDNRFGFPHPEVAARWARAGAHCSRTDLDGAVTFESDGEHVRLLTWRPRAPQPTDASVAPVAGAPHP